MPNQQPSGTTETVRNRFPLLDVVIYCRSGPVPALAHHLAKGHQNAPKTTRANSGETANLIASSRLQQDRPTASLAPFIMSVVIIAK
jgi:hypothetical protein